MKKIILSMNVTLDGYMAGASCELDWHFNFWNEEMSSLASEQLNNADTIMLGRVTYTQMAGYWPCAGMNPSFPREDIAYAEMMNSYNKIVFSRTLNTTQWHNSTVFKDSSPELIKTIKQQPGKDIMIFGSGKLVSALMGWDLIDEYLLWVHPVVLGKGKLLFSSPSTVHSMKLVSSKTLGSGVVLIFYRK